MAESPDQFQRHVRVRLPIADRFLGTPQEAAAAALDLEQCFRHPLLSMTIAPSAREPGRAQSAAGKTGTPPGTPKGNPTRAAAPWSAGCAGP